MKLRVSRRAREDVTEIGRYVRERSATGALTVRRALQEALQTIADHPESGRALGGDLRRFAVPRLPYLIYYRVDAVTNLVLVVTIRHGARNPVQAPSS